MLKALLLLIRDLTQENITRGVQKSINEMAYAVSVSEAYTDTDRKFAHRVFESSGRPYAGFIPTVKQLVKEYQDETV